MPPGVCTQRGEQKTVEAIKWTIGCFEIIEVFGRSSKQATITCLERSAIKYICYIYIYTLYAYIYIYYMHSSNEGTNMHLAASKKIEQSFTVI